MQFKGKLVNQSCTNGKRPNFGPGVGSFGPKLPPPPNFFFRGFYIYWMLGIVASYHCMQFQGKYMSQTQ